MADKSNPVPVTFDVVATLRYGVTVDGYQSDEEAARKHAISLIMDKTGATSDQILYVHVRQRARQNPTLTDD